MKKLNITVLFLLLFTLVISCKNREKDAKILDDINSDEIIFTDNFLPTQWDHPMSRKKVVAQDKDIGIFIDKDTFVPEQRKILRLMNEFIGKISTGRINECQSLFTRAAFNSFQIRNEGIRFSKNYTIRVSVPPSGNTDRFWLKLKIIFDERSFFGDIEVLKDNEEYVINEFDNELFENIRGYK